ncbi:carbohydrate ABC transporter permease [Actinocorallia sp. A-T 12471]|uniref:carbohydrate ABC transporter permease n=1 Tax=Actinocorallia sp. A-T 12471 TaxID=3089813 RepID=UPI0029CB9937|nr:carbohydrate ABC transporter permease [Actinocorallia sp. A-T 12471]MDX6741206.1 carbohydrate ABC transporter permease [Actinocorallia sp. A-T 12471]
MKTKTEPPARPEAVPTVRKAPARGGRRPAAVASGVFSGLSHAALAVWALLVIVPLVWTFVAAFKTNAEIFGDAWTLPETWHFDAWGRAWRDTNIGRYLLNSVFVVSLSTFFTMLFGAMAAYVIARYEFRGNRVVYFMFVSGMMFPVFLALVPLFKVVQNLGVHNTYLGLILVYVAYSLPFTVFFLTAFFRTLPTSVAEAAFIDGAGHVRTFFQIMMPMARPGLVSITIFNVIGQWNQYLLPIIIVPADQDKWVLPQAIATISTTAGYRQDWPALMAALSMAIIPVLIIYVIFQRQIQSGLTAGAVK